MVSEIKKQEVVEITDMLQKYTVIGILDMYKFPARQLQQIRESLRGSAIIRVCKKSILVRAFNNIDKDNLKNLKHNIKGQPALIFSDENPFLLFKRLKESRSPASAKIGDIAPNDITIPKGPTGIPPGPAISILQKVGLKTSVQGGKITVMQDKTVVQAGKPITEDMVSVFNLLKLEPMEIGLSMLAAWEHGYIYIAEVLDISTEEVIADIHLCFIQGVNLAVNTGYPTKDAIDTMLAKAFTEARSLCTETQIAEKDFIDDVLLKAIREAESIKNKTGG